MSTNVEWWKWTSMFVSNAFFVHVTFKIYLKIKEKNLNLHEKVTTKYNNLKKLLFCTDFDKYVFIDQVLPKTWTRLPVHLFFVDR